VLLGQLRWDRTARSATEPTPTPCAPAQSRTPAPWRRSPVPTRPRTATAVGGAAADRGGGRRHAAAGARPSRSWPPADAHL